tara:strand:- start:455 stop:1006 length:552 start_codon:yes stop_codon:yes gene_type:complete
MGNPLYGSNSADKKLDAVSGLGVVCPTIVKTPVGAGAFPDLAVNTHYIVTGTITASTKTLPAGELGDVIYVEMVSETVVALMVTNSAALVFKTPGATFEYGSKVTWDAMTDSSGSAILSAGIDCTAALATNDNTVTLTGATNGGPGNGTWLKFTKGENLWRLEGHAYGAGNLQALPNVAIANT